MRYNRLLLWTVMLILVCSSAFAAAPTTDYMISYYTFNSSSFNGQNANDTWGTDRLFEGGAPDGDVEVSFNGVANNSANQTVGGATTSEKWMCTGVNSTVNNSAFTMNYWVSVTSNSGVDYMLSEENVDVFAIGYDGTKINFYDWTAGANTLVYNVDLSDGNFHMITFTYNSSNKYEMWYNGTLVKSNTTNGILVGDSRTCLFNRNGESRGLTGAMDEVGFWGRVLEDDEIVSLYNGGDGLAFNGTGFGNYSGAPPAPPSGSNFSVTANDTVNGLTILSFDINVYNGTDIYNWSTTNGTLETSINNQDLLLNITVSADNYTSRTYTNWNMSLDLGALLEYFFYVEARYNNPVMEIHQQTMNFTINISASVTNTSVTLVYDGTSRTTTRVISNASQHTYSATFTTPFVTADSNKTFTWLYNVQQAIGNETGSASYNQTVLLIAIDNCTTYTEPAVNYSIRDELNNTLITSDFEILFTIWNQSTSFLRNYSFNEAGQSSYKFCLKPGWLIVTSDISALYSAPSYAEKSYVAEDYYLDNVTNYVTLYLLHDAASQTVTLHVSNQDDDEMEDVEIRIFKYSLGWNNYTFIQSGFTNFNGELTVQLVNDTTYRFDLYTNGALAKSEELKILTTTTDLFFKIIEAVTTTLENYLNLLYDMTHSLTHQASTDLVWSSWDNSAGHASEFCLKVSELNETGSSTWYLNCTTQLSANGINVTFTNFTNHTYVAVLKAKSTVDGLYYVVETINIDYATANVPSEQEFLLYGWLLVGTAAFIGLAVSPVVSIGMMLFALFMAKVMGLIMISYIALVGICIGGFAVMIVLRT